MNNIQLVNVENSLCWLEEYIKGKIRKKIKK